MDIRLSINQCQTPIIVFNKKLKLVNTNISAKKLFRLNAQSNIQKQLIVERHLGKQTINTIQNCISLKQINFVSEEIKIYSQWYNLKPLYCNDAQVILQLIQVTHLVKIKNQLINAEKKAQVLLDELPIIIYEEDFSDIKKRIDSLKRKGVKDFKQYFFKNPTAVKELASLIKITGINKTSLKFYEAENFEELLMEIPKWFMEESWTVFRDEMIAIAKGNFEFKGEIVVKSPRNKIKHLYLSLYIPQDNRKKLDKVIVSFIDITERVAIENKLNLSLQKLSTLSKHLYQIREAEQKRIANEIHDEAGSMLTVLKMSFARLHQQLPLKQFTKPMYNINKQVDELYTSLRSIATNLRPSILDNLGLMAALKWQTKEFNSRTGLKINFTTNVEALKCANEIGTNFFRFYQELINNALKHSQAKEIKASLTKTKTNTQLIVIDNGIGFDNTKKNKKHSFGLLSIDERAKMIGATFTINSKLNKGVTAKITLPNNKLQ
jgi:signal transduction histidine kinase